MKNILIISVLAMALSGCGKKPSKQSFNKGDFQLELLFEHEGCKIYRFVDYRTIYWSDCRGKITEQHTESNGKSSAKTVTNETINGGN